LDPRLRARSVRRSGRDTVRVRRNFGSPAAATKFYCSTRGGGHRCSWSSPSAEVARACARAGRDRARTVYLVPPMHAVAARIIVGWSGAAGLAAVPALGGGGEARRPRSELAYHHRSRGQARPPRAAAGRRPRRCQPARPCACVATSEAGSQAKGAGSVKIRTGCLDARLGKGEPGKSTAKLRFCATGGREKGWGFFRHVNRKGTRHLFGHLVRTPVPRISRGGHPVRDRGSRFAGRRRRRLPAGRGVALASVKSVCEL